MLIKQKAVKDFALECARLRHQNGGPKLTRCSREFLQRMDRRLAETIRLEINKHPSLGVTLK